jgi:hypothetical protein
MNANQLRQKETGRKRDDLRKSKKHGMNLFFIVDSEGNMYYTDFKYQYSVESMKVIGFRASHKESNGNIYFKSYENNEEGS